ncbi:MAG TPA: carboxymuconolactone decarboxylase family protein [Candidatus Dormibacteraeota bacterium]|nr:carboxymuconolactone decarboxylase family protein [Candidatus Dormibacteraeota bacterium]
MSDDRERGREWFERVMGMPVPAVPPDPFLEATVDHLFADVWSRPGLAVRDRRIATLVVLVQLGNESVLRLHLAAAMRQRQLSDLEIDELILHVAHYGGWPGAAVASRIVRQLRAERDAAAAGGD